MVACSSCPGWPSQEILTARERSSGGESAKVAVLSDAVERALLDDDARIHVQLAFLVDAADDVADDRSWCRQPFLQSSLERLVEHDGLEGMNRHQLQVGGEFFHPH